MTTLQIIGVVLLSVPVLFALLLIGLSMAYPLTAQQKAQLKRERDISWRKVKEHQKEHPSPNVGWMIFGPNSH